MNSTKKKLFFISIILITCCYNMDKNISYNTFLDNDKIKDILTKLKLDIEIINYIYKKYNYLRGDVYYLRNSADTECMIMITKNDLYIIFCGTQFSFNDKLSLIKDIITDFKIALVEIDKSDPNVKIQNGFKDNIYCDNLFGQIYEIVLKHLDLNMFICGHSMGCGLALYCSILLEKKIKKKNFNLITISPTKIGNINLKKYIQSKKYINHINMINNNEIIPLYPFNNLDYHHIAKNIWNFKKDGTLVKKNSIDLSIFMNYSINDHFCHEIIKNIYKNIIL